ncbi:helix-turn-helix transcriptional regulator [Fulvivirga sp. M361]|uniref:helix-turn-helix domain-containing protein n=1 Tax=Fulvivirga sp. M361 TaxID=2594266 RepID=UPI00117A8DFA|nr:helix-turn-helix transcriptional regulator [Fulvivirga sp. M361]TRX61381.1 helix-turn-helix transcriptional regulator [Fulvivirga sp. M361]
MESTTHPHPVHLGRKVMQMRELLGISQESIAGQLGISQQAVSKIEQKEAVDDTTLDRIAKALGVNSDAIKNLDEQATVYNIVTNHGAVNEGAIIGNHGYNYQCTFNPVDKWVEAIEDNKKLYEELLKSEREKVALLEKVLDKLK